MVRRGPVFQLMSSPIWYIFLLYFGSLAISFKAINPVYAAPLVQSHFDHLIPFFSQFCNCQSPAFFMIFKTESAWKLFCPSNSSEDRKNNDNDKKHKRNFFI